MQTNVIEFSKLEKELEKTQKSPLNYLTPEIGKINVIAITREGCSGCEKQKPKLDELLKAAAKKHGAKVMLTRIHVKHNPSFNEESLRSKDMLGHYFYPTNLVLLRTADRGPIEYYRNVNPNMEELRKNIENALEIAKMFEKETG